MGILSNRAEESELSPGDHIYSWRKRFAYAHHCIYMGEGTVVHYTPLNRSGPLEMWCACGIEGMCSTKRSCSFPAPLPAECPACEKMMESRKPRSTTGVVVSSCMDCFLAGGYLYRFDYKVSNFSYWFKIRGGTCSTEEPSPAYIVIERASYALDHGFGEFNLFKNNCEDFAVFCKTGQKAGKVCSQATSVTGTVAAAVISKAQSYSCRS